VEITIFLLQLTNCSCGWKAYNLRMWSDLEPWSLMVGRSHLSKSKVLYLTWKRSHYYTCLFFVETWKDINECTLCQLMVLDNQFFQHWYQIVPLMLINLEDSHLASLLLVSSLYQLRDCLLWTTILHALACGVVVVVDHIWSLFTISWRSPWNLPLLSWYHFFGTPNFHAFWKVTSVV